MAPNSDQATYYARVVQRTQECLDEINNMQDGPANVLILKGRTGVGKSAFLECLTDAQGHSSNSRNAVTLQFQLESANINGKKYYIMDTPGFDTDKEWEVFVEIVRGINAVRLRARIIGVLLLTRINDSRAEAIDEKLIQFVKEFCGEKYTPQVTIVTTFWTAFEKEEMNDLDATFKGLVQHWNKSFHQTVAHYQHGRRYKDSSDTEVHLSWYKDREEIKKYAKEMIDRRYANVNPQDPQIIEELVAKKKLEITAPGRFLRPSSTSRSSSAPQQPPKRTWGEFLSTLIPREVHFHVGGGAQLPAMGRIQRSRTDIPPQYDPNSSVDLFKKYGMDSSLESRTAWAQERGIRTTPGSAAFGNEVHRQFTREHNL